MGGAGLSAACARHGYGFGFYCLTSAGIVRFLIAPRIQKLKRRMT